MLSFYCLHTHSASSQAWPSFCPTERLCHSVARRVLVCLYQSCTTWWFCTLLCFVCLRALLFVSHTCMLMCKHKSTETHEHTDTPVFMCAVKSQQVTAPLHFSQLLPAIYRPSLAQQRTILSYEQIAGERGKTSYLLFLAWRQHMSAYSAGQIKYTTPWFNNK